MIVNDKLNREWTDISSEEFRTYTFSEASVRIDKPVALNVSSSGGHRLLDDKGISHYVPSGWLHIEWQSDPHFVK